MPSDSDVHRLRTEVAGDEEIQTTFRRLRRDGHSRLEAVRMILDALDVSLSEAKTLLHTNETWNEARSAAGVPSEPARGEASSGVEAPDDPVPPAPG